MWPLVYLLSLVSLSLLSGRKVPFGRKLFYTAPTWRSVDTRLSSSCFVLRSEMNRLVALARMQHSGVFLSTSEALTLQLIKDAAHPQFKEVKALLCHPGREDIFLFRFPFFSDFVLLYVFPVCMSVRHLRAWHLGALKRPEVLD